MKRALVISGGGSKGAFAVGVVKKLFNQYPGLRFDMIIGTSTGSLIAPLAALPDIDLLEELYTTQTTDKIIIKDNLGNRLNQHSVFDANPLWDLIEHYYTDAAYQNLSGNPTRIYLTTTCLQTGELEVYTTEPVPASSRHYIVRTLQNAEQFRRAVMASACQPVFMPPIKINKQIPGEQHPDYQYVDGGVREYAGIQMAIDNGAEEIFTIVLTPELPETAREDYKTIFPILSRTIEIFTTDVGRNDLIIPQLYNEALEYIDAVKRKMKRDGVSSEKIKEYFSIRGRENPFEDKMPLRLFLIRPDNHLGGGPGGLVFDPAEMRHMVATGENRGGHFIASLDPKDVSWA